MWMVVFKSLHLTLSRVEDISILYRPKVHMTNKADVIKKKQNNKKITIEENYLFPFLLVHLK